VPKREYTGWWGASVSGLPPEQRANWSKTHDALLLPPGIYDVHWMQDHEHQPLLLAAQVRVERGQRTDLAADTGISLEVAEWVPKREYTCV
jgi:hypothetical protein